MITSVDEILGEATKFEKKYEWLQASELYGQALGMVDEEDYFRRGEVQEKIGHSLHRVAFQAENREEFLERLQQGVEAYEIARGLYEKVADARATSMFQKIGKLALGEHTDRSTEKRVAQIQEENFDESKWSSFIERHGDALLKAYFREAKMEWTKRQDHEVSLESEYPETPNQEVEPGLSGSI